jgi:hypothetical protein
VDNSYAGQTGTCPGCGELVVIPVPNTQPTQPAVAAIAKNAVVIYKNDQQEGPYDLLAIEQGLQDGRFAPSDLAWLEGCSDWVPLHTILPVSPQPYPHHSATVSSKINEKIAQANATLARFLGEDQDPAVVEKVMKKAKELLTRGEEIEYVGVQKKPIVTIAPDAVLLTNKRFMIVRPKIMGMTFEDHVWREVVNVHMSEQMLSATISCTIIGGRKLEIDSIPKKQARKIYTYAQEVEERMHEERRSRDMEEKRAAAGGVVIQAPMGTAPQASAPSGDDPMVTLGRLKQMLEAGFIEVSEYDAKKAEVLSRI